MIVLTCLDGEKTMLYDPCPMGQRVEYTEGVVLTQPEYNSYMAMSQPVDVVLATKVFFFFFISSLTLWLVGKVIGTVVKFVREA
jgi:hypothetical protein